MPVKVYVARDMEEGEEFNVDAVAPSPYDVMLYEK